MLHYVPRLRGNDAKGRIKIFYEIINLKHLEKIHFHCHIHGHKQSTERFI